MRKTLPLVLFLSYGVILICMSFMKSTGVLLSEIHRLEYLMGGDKVMHFTLASILAFLACFASGRVLDLAGLKRIMGVLCGLFLALMVDEALQNLSVNRRFEWLDLAYGSAGLITGGVGYLSISLLKKTRNGH